MTPALESAMAEHPDCKIFVWTPKGYQAFRTQADCDAWQDDEIKDLP